MQDNTPNYNKCKKCGNFFVVGWEREHLVNYCEDCQNEGWFEDMKKAKCTTADPSKIGNIPHLIPKKKKDLPVVEVQGTKYVDATDLLFESDKYKKTYPNNEEWEKITRYEKKKKTVKRNDKTRVATYKNIMAENTSNRDKIKRLRNLGYMNKKIREDLGLTEYQYQSIIYDLRNSGEITVAPSEHYTREEELDILEMVARGIDCKEIAIKYGKTYKTMYEKISRLRKKGVC
ncbi:MAG TPA: hypothetical protein GX707_17605 [Epulopiscium sp.]|nr:hypothetical protein [Candidatus Epulonipiscium sp.]